MSVPESQVPSCACNASRTCISHPLRNQDVLPQALSNPVNVFATPSQHGTPSNTPSMQPSTASCANGFTNAPKTPMANETKVAFPPPPLRKLSAEASSFLGRHQDVPFNTQRSNRQCILDFCAFYVKHHNISTPAPMQSAENPSAPSWKKYSVLELTRMYLFRDQSNVSVPDNHREWSEYQLQNINAALIEYIAHVRNKRNGKELAPNTLKTYVAGVQRAFACEWGFEFNFFSGPVFSDKNTGVAAVLDNKIRQSQAAGSGIRIHNTLSREHIEKLYASPMLSKQTPRGFITRIIFDLALMTAFRKSELWALRMEDVTICEEQGEKVCRVVGRIRAGDRSSKSQSGDVALGHVRTKDICIRNKEQLSGLLNVYRDLEEYIELVSTIRQPGDHFLTAVNYAALDRKKFFKYGNLGTHSIANYVGNACKELGIIGEGPHDHFNVQGLRETAIRNPFECGFGGSSVASRSHHRDLVSFNAPRNLNGTLRYQQQEASLGPTKVPTQIEVGENLGTLMRGTKTKRDAEHQAVDKHGQQGCTLTLTFSPKRQRVEGRISGIGNVAGQITVNINLKPSE